MGGGKPSKNNLIRIVDNLSLNLRPKNSPEIKGKITKEATKKILYIPSSKRLDSYPLKTEEDKKQL